MSTSESAYHHGSLRTALIGAGLASLEGGAGAALSLRELARNVGVSPAAVYRHFPNKDALLAALAEEGLAVQICVFAPPVTGAHSEVKVRELAEGL